MLEGEECFTPPRVGIALSWEYKDQANLAAFKFFKVLFLIQILTVTEIFNTWSR